MPCIIHGRTARQPGSQECDPGPLRTTYRSQDLWAFDMWRQAADVTSPATAESVYSTFLRSSNTSSSREPRRAMPRPSAAPCCVTSLPVSRSDFSRKSLHR